MAHPTTARLSNTFRILSTLTEITEHASWRRAVRCIQEQREWLDNLQIALTEIPAPTF
jgi:hypothetical protein